LIDVDVASRHVNDFHLTIVTGKKSDEVMIKILT